MTIARWKVAALAAAGVMAAAPALAQDEAPRYQMTETDNGIVRLDTRTGHVSLCRALDDQLVCKSAADDRRALDDEISSLESENETLRSRLAELEGAAKLDEEEETRSPLSLPSDEELNRVIGFMERLMRRFYAFTQTLRGEPGEET